VVEVPGKWNRTTDAVRENIVLLETYMLTDVVIASCKQEVSLIKQTRRVRHASILFSKMDPVRQALMRGTIGQCGRDSAHCSLSTIRAVATMDCPSFVSLEEAPDASLFCAATLHRYDLPHYYARLENYTLPETCHYCQAPLWNLDLSISRSDRIFVWQCHMGRCGEDGRRLQAHEAVKLAIKRLVLSCPDPAGCAFPIAYVLIEPRHLRQDN